MRLQAAFASLRCDGDSLMSQAVHPWKLTPGLQQGVQGLAVASCVLALLLTLVVARYRALPVFRLASVPFLVMILTGLPMAFFSLQYWARAPTARDCSVFDWLLNLGFTLSFGPLFAKVWRVWRIFGRQALRVVKITNWMLARMVAVLVVFDIIVLSVWQASDANWTAVTTYQLNTDQSLTSYTSCAPRADRRNAGYLALLGVSKLALLLYGAVIGLATRNVAQTFNESKQIAYALYSTCFTLAVVLTITLLLGLLGNALIATVALGLWWVFFSVLACLFIPKLVELKEKLKTFHHSGTSSLAAANADPALKMQSLDFSFPSLAMIPAEQMSH